MERAEECGKNGEVKFCACEVSFRTNSITFSRAFSINIACDFIHFIEYYVKPDYTNSSQYEQKLLF